MVLYLPQSRILECTFGYHTRYFNHFSHLLFRMNTNPSHEGHKQHRSQTLPIIRGKNALSNPKLLQMLDSTMTSK